MCGLIAKNGLSLALCTAARAGTLLSLLITEEFFCGHA